MGPTLLAFNIHQVLLARMPHLCDNQPVTSIINLLEISPAAFTEIIDYVYLGCTKFKQRMASKHSQSKSKHSESDGHLLTYIFSLSVKWGVEGLSNDITDIFRKNRKTWHNTLQELVELAEHRVQDDHMLDFALKQIAFEACKQSMGMYREKHPRYFYDFTELNTKDVRLYHNFGTSTPSSGPLDDDDCKGQVHNATRRCLGSREKKCIKWKFDSILTNSNSIPSESDSRPTLCTILAYFKLTRCMAN